MDRLPQEITIEVKGRDPVTIKNIINGAVSLKKLKKVCGSNIGGVIYKQNGKNYPIVPSDEDEDTIRLESNIENYELLYTENPQAACFNPLNKDKESVYLEMVDKVKKTGKRESIDENKKESIYSNKKVGHTKVKGAAKKYIHVNWRHKSKSSLKYDTLNAYAGQRKISLPLEQVYTVEEIKIQIIMEYNKSQITHSIFENSVVELGDCNSNPIYEFCVGDKFVGLWKYAEKRPDMKNRITLYILTEEININSEAKLSKSNESIAEIDLSNSFDSSIEGQSTKDSYNTSKERQINNTSLSYLQNKYNSQKIATFKRPDASKNRKETIDNTARKSTFDNNKSSQNCNTKAINLSNVHDFPSSSKSSDNDYSKKHNMENKSPAKCKKPDSENGLSSLLKSKSVTSTATTIKRPGLTVSSNIQKKTIKTSNMDDSKTKEKNFSNSYYEESDKFAVFMDLQEIDNLKTPLATQIPFDDLTISDLQIGSGGQGVVKIADWNGTMAAVKVLDTVDQNPKTIFREVENMRAISHKNIVSIMGVSYDKNLFYILMDFINGRNLEQIIFKEQAKAMYNLDLDIKNYIAFQLSSAFKFIHNHPSKMLHRDIKPANVIIERHTYHVYVCDLGYAQIKEVNHQLVTTVGKGMSIVGTLKYMPPELFFRKAKYSTKSDMWSFSQTLAEMYHGGRVWQQIVFSANLRNDMISRYQRKEKPDLQSMPLALLDLFEKAFSYVPVERPEAAEFMDAIRPLVNKEKFSVL